MKSKDALLIALVMALMVVGCAGPEPIEEPEQLGNLAPAVSKSIANHAGIMEASHEAYEEFLQGRSLERAFTKSFNVDAGEWMSTGSNPFFVLEPGYELVFSGTEDGEDLTLTILVTEETKKVDGVETRVVTETETKNGKVVEISRNFFAISKKSNSVFYFGEDVDIYKDGKVVSHDGAWLSGEKGAKWGLMMPGICLLGARYYQEVAPDVAMDRAEITDLSFSLETPAGKFENCLVTKETTPLEKGASTKVYARGIGLVADGELKLARHGKKK
jgi:hypothetical protein